MDRLEKNNIVKEVEDSFLEYSMSVIVARALPDLRDDLTAFPTILGGFNGRETEELL